MKSRKTRGRRDNMIEIRRCKRHGVCNNCGRQQSKAVPIREIRMSITGQGWSALMLCEQCLSLFREAITEAEYGDDEMTVI